MSDTPDNKSKNKSKSNRSSPKSESETKKTENKCTSSPSAGGGREEPAAAGGSTGTSTSALAAAGLGPPALGRASSGSFLTQRDRMLAAIPPSLRASQSLDLSAASIPPGLRPSQSLDLASQAAIPPTLRAAQSLDLGPPSLGRSGSLELAAARRAAALGGMGGMGMGGMGMGMGMGMGYHHPAMYDPRQRLLLAQQAAAMGFPPGGGAGPMFGMGMGAAMNPLGGVGQWRNMPNEGVTTQGLELLRAASLSLPNRGGVGGLPPNPQGMGTAAAASGFASAASMAAAGAGLAIGLQPQISPGFSPETAGGAANKKRKAKEEGDSSDDDDEDEGSSEKVFIPEIRDLDILCGRGGKSNHHFGNKRYRQVVSEMKMMYRSTEAKTVKTDLSRAIVDHVCSYGGRFVKKDSATGRYYLLTKAEARKKTSQALRETKALKWTM